jgi:hypothetical protein
MAEAGDKGTPLKDYIKVHEQPEPLVRAKLERGCRADTGQACVMTGPEAIDWVARIAREIEPIQRSWQRFTRDIEQATKPFAGEWRQLFEAWQQLSRAFVAARDRGDFRDFQFRLQLTVWMGQQINDAKGNPSDRRARAWLMVQHLTPKQIAVLLPYMFMDMPDLRIPKRRGRQKGRTATNTLKMTEQLAERIERTGELPTTAARSLFPEHGFRGLDLKGRADHLVRVWKRRAFKSR